MGNTDPRLEHLNRISSLIVEAREIADSEKEHMLGAKLDDCALCAQEIITYLEK